jgi:hypothetical protein
MTSSLSLPRKSLVESEQGLTVIVYAGRIKDQHPGFANFISSLKLAGFSDILMKEPPGQEILSHIGTPNNTFESIFWVQRLEEFQRVASTYPSDHLLLICDSFDVLFGLSISTFLSRFESLKSDIIFSTEMLCDTISCRNDNWLTEWFHSRSPNPKNPYHYLNAGLLVGRAHSLNIFLTCSLKYAKNGRDDQTSFALCFHEFHTNTPEMLKVELDYDSILFGNIPPIDFYFDQNWVLDEEKHIRSENVFQSPTQDLPEISFISRSFADSQKLVTPVAIHFPGMAYRPSYTLFNPCQQFLRWKYNQLGFSSFAHGDIPNLFRPRPILNSLQLVTDPTSNETIQKFNILKSDQEYRVIVTLVVESGKGSNFFDQMSRDLYSLFEHNRFVYIAKLYLLVRTSSNPQTVSPSQEELTSKLKEFQEFVDLEIIVTTTPAADTSILDIILEKEPPDSHDSRQSPQSLIVILRQSISPTQKNFIDHFFKRYLLDPGAVYGFGGWMIDEMIGSNKDQWKIKSAGLWSGSSSSSFSVDILDFANGIIFPRSFFDESFHNFMASPVSIGTEGGGCTCEHNDEEVRISAYFSFKGVPRIQLQQDSTQLQQQSQTFIHSVHAPPVPCDCHLLPLLDHFRLSWLSPEHEESCPTNSFQSLRVIDNLPGFSWQLNWDPNSHTSACTTHLMTHASQGAHFVGVGQYLSEHHRIYSPQRKFIIRLEVGARLCLYSLDDSGLAYATSPTRCLEPPPATAGVVSAPESLTTTPHYLAIQDGELCFYSGTSPHFGSTKKESQHRSLEWCTSSTYPRHSSDRAVSLGSRRRRLLQEANESPAIQALKNRMREKIADLLQKRVQEEIQDCQNGGNEIESEYWESVYLHVTDDGIFGLFYSSNTSPSDRMTAEKRIDSFVMAKCF